MSERAIDLIENTLSTVCKRLEKPSLVLGLFRNSFIHFFMRDHIGSVVRVLNAAQQNQTGKTDRDICHLHLLIYSGITNFRARCL